MKILLCIKIHQMKLTVIIINKNTSNENEQKYYLPLKIYQMK
jgi:hypothetical protein